jgi:3-phytase
MKYALPFGFFLLLTWVSCKNDPVSNAEIQPLVVTQKVRHDSDDPAIWIHPEDPSQSLILGTDKGGDSGEGALFVFRMDGTIDSTRTIWDLKRPNNVDIAYGLPFKGGKVDIAVCTERNTNSLRIFSLPDMASVDGGGVPVFEGDTNRAPMGIALYTDLIKGDIYAIVSRKTGPTDSYLHQYRLQATEEGTVKAEFVRAFGRFEGGKEIEAIAIDNELGYVYYSDEGSGVRKYHAHPDSADTELAFFATDGIKEDHEGISIYKAKDGTGYILLSDQQSNEFHMYPREGADGRAHHHPLLRVVKLATRESDGSDVTSVALNSQFSNGMLVAMSTDGTFHFYRWEDLAGDALFLAPNGEKKTTK